MRDYRAMRLMLLLTAKLPKPIDPLEFIDVGDAPTVAAEFDRLEADGLIEGNIVSNHGHILGGQVQGLTDEGETFLRLIENERVWLLMVSTLDKAGIDVSYPLLKEVCEEIVKRYVTSFIPEI